VRSRSDSIWAKEVRHGWAAVAPERGLGRDTGLDPDQQPADAVDAGDDWAGGASGRGPGRDRADATDGIGAVAGVSGHSGADGGGVWGGGGVLCLPAERVLTGVLPQWNGSKYYCFESVRPGELAGAAARVRASSDEAGGVEAAFVVG